jgi:hypothetical protein
MNEHRTTAFDELLEAFEWVGMEPNELHHAYVCRATGQVYCSTDADGVPKDELPEDVDDPEKYASPPHKRQLELGSALALRFASEHVPARFGQIEAGFRRRGGFGRSKAILEQEHKLAAWYDYESAATVQALRDWVREERLPIALE